MRLNVNTATDMTKENDIMAKVADDFLKQEVKDPALRELLEPHSKCVFLPPFLRSDVVND
jgi:hypothetical protein